MTRFICAQIFFVASVVFAVNCLTINNYHNGYTAVPVKLRQSEKENQQDLSKVPGVPGVDYPIYHRVPHTGFSCHNVPVHPGMYANVETGCQAYHVCHDGREGEQGSSFLCTNGTIFNQKEFTCDWWYNVNCHEAQEHYRLNLEPGKNPYFPTPKPEEELLNKYVHVADKY
ncbi:unnamed protein product [Brassicogethes aeneus]|uniref:Chitin-binding type-2 domain-containing protein n=1 Tax=Brassicogethes aeneus TaxID=1431903 RepID=A0A9P0BE99_BRAAE|nr:unnamed protein product [Brassicogethes aeneus]